MRRKAKIDDNQNEVVKALRKAGCNVLSLAATGNGCPDLLVQRGAGASANLYLIEVKDGAKYPSQRSLTPHQIRFHRDWYVHTVKNIEEALEACGI